MAVYWLCSRLLFPRSGAETMAGAAAASYYNSVNIGLPIATYVIGDATYVIPALVLQMAVLSPFIIAGLNAQGTSLRSIWSSVVSGVTAPVVLAAVAGFIVSAAQWQVPDVVMKPLEILGGASIPMILMSFGASLKGDALLEEDRLPTITATVLKLVGMPAIALAVGAALGLDGAELYAALILAALPTAQNVYNYAATYEVGETVARDTVFSLPSCRFLRCWPSLPYLAKHLVNPDVERGKLALQLIWIDSSRHVWTSDGGKAVEHRCPVVMTVSIGYVLCAG